MRTRQQCLWRSVPGVLGLVALRCANSTSGPGVASTTMSTGPVVPANSRQVVAKPDDRTCASADASATSSMETSTALVPALVLATMALALAQALVPVPTVVRVLAPIPVRTPVLPYQFSHQRYH